MPHQIEGVRYGLRETNPALFMEMRTGKTLTLIRLVQRLGGFERILILAPITVLEAWESELRREGEQFFTCYGQLRERRDRVTAEAWFNPGRTWLLMSYGSFLATGEARTSISFRDGEAGKVRRKRDTPDLAALPWDLVGLDESTHIKNPQAQITQACMKGFRNAKRRAALTGLPNPEGDLDLVSQFLYLDGHFMGYRNFWEARNALFLKCGFDWVHKHGVRAQIKDYVHDRAYVLTAHQAGMRSKTVFQVRRVDMSPAQKKLYKQIERDFAASLASGETLETQWKLTQQSWLRQVAAGFEPGGKLLSDAKTREIVNLLKTELGNKQVVVWFTLRAELDHVKEALRKAKISCVSITGDETLKERTARLATFRRGTRVLLAMERCAQFGVDCSCADTAIYHSNEWSNQARSQSLKRIVHPKKKRTHLVIDLVTRGTVDEDVIMVVNKKGMTARLFMDAIERRFRERLKLPVGSPRRRVETLKPRIKRKQYAAH